MPAPPPPPPGGPPAAATAAVAPATPGAIITLGPVLRRLTQILVQSPGPDDRARLCLRVHAAPGRPGSDQDSRRHHRGSRDDDARVVHIELLKQALLRISTIMSSDRWRDGMKKL
jgi:hypothetical protein